MVWPLPLSLATTYGITIVLFSSSYLDVSVQRVRDYCLPDFIGMGCPIRTSADLRSFAPPRSFSQLTTSFVASGSQGIPHTPLFRFHLFTMRILQPNIALLLQSISSGALLGSVFLYTLFLLLLCPVLSMNFLHAQTPISHAILALITLYSRDACNGDKHWNRTNPQCLCIACPQRTLSSFSFSPPTTICPPLGGGYRIRTDDP